MASLFLFSKMALNLSVSVHPVVLLTIVDSYERRNEHAQRVIGTLLGTMDKGKVEITNCFSVPHNESDVEVAVELDFAKDMYELYHKVNLTETIVGWFATGPEITEHSVLIHEYYSRECPNPLHLTVDTSLSNFGLDVKAYISVPMGVPGKTSGTMFASLPVAITSYEPETVGITASLKGGVNPQKVVDCPSDLQQVAAASKRMQEMLDVVMDYVDRILEEKIPPNKEIGRHLLSLAHSIPKMSPEEFEEMLNTNVK
ncbi:unnamed protein product, partial [Darwinula stevensoni]